MTINGPNNQQGTLINNTNTMGVAVGSGAKQSYRPKGEILILAMRTIGDMMGQANRTLQIVSTFILEPTLGTTNSLALRLGSITFQVVDANDKTKAASATLHNNNQTALQGYLNALMRALQTQQQQDMQLATSSTQNIQQISGLFQQMLQTLSSIIQSVNRISG